MTSAILNKIWLFKLLDVFGKKDTREIYIKDRLLLVERVSISVFLVSTLIVGVTWFNDLQETQGCRLFHANGAAFSKLEGGMTRYDCADGHEVSPKPQY